MLAATLYSFSNNLRLNSITRGRLRSDDFEAISRNVTTFISHGLCALLRPPRPQATRRKNPPPKGSARNHVQIRARATLRA